MDRPRPPKSLLDPEGPLGPRFAPAPDALDWLRGTFIEDGGALQNPDHAHLRGADLCVLWAAGGFVKQQRQVVGQMEQVMFRAGGWAKWRAEDQMNAWFGRVPGFVMTLDASYAAHCSDVDWCALVEHELYHVGQALDEAGQPAFTREGQAKLAMRGHDVEEFIGVVRRYGAVGSVKDMVDAALRPPQVPHFTAAHACGTCIARAA